MTTTMRTRRSSVTALGHVFFPGHTGERVYMREFRKQDGLPSDLIRWQPTVDMMLRKVNTDGPIYLMVDQMFVRAGEHQRRPGLHVDGWWDPGSGHGTEPRHGLSEPAPLPIHGMNRAYTESLILATNVCGCVAYEGDYDGEPKADGDCAHIGTRHMRRTPLTPFVVWAGDAVLMLHETIPMQVDCTRTVVRLNVPGWLPEQAS